MKPWGLTVLSLTASLTVSFYMQQLPPRNLWATEPSVPNPQTQTDGHGHKSADAGWGFAAWIITDYFSDYYADDVFDVQWYPNMKW